MFVRIVGSRKYPGRSTRLPPSRTVAPPSTALSIWLSTSVSARSVHRGASVVLGSVGSPGTNFASAPLKRFKNSSAIVSSRMNRLAATQHWPALFMRPKMAQFDRLVHIAVAQDDESVGTARLHCALLQGLACLGRHG